MMEQYKVVILDISSYVGSSIGASHTYGELIHRFGGKTKKVQVERPMTAQEAARENKKDRDRGSPMVHKPGDITSRLRDEQDVIDMAIGMWNDHFPYAHILLVQKAWSSEPGKIIDALDMDAVLPINVLWADYLQAQDEDWPEDEIVDISYRWREALDSYLSTLPDIEYVPDEEANEYDFDVADFLVRNAKRKAELKEQERLAEQRWEDDRIRRQQEFQDWYETQKFDEITITVKARTTFVENEDGTGRGFFTFFVGVSDVFEGEERIGSVKGGIDASVWLNHESVKHPYRISVPDLWDAFMVALEKSDG